MWFPWVTAQTVIVSILYVFAIITGIFRTFYRSYISRFWWEDIWATLALLFGIICFINVWMMTSNDAFSTVQWINAIAFSSGLWAARMSMITTIIRITNHHVWFRRFAYATAAAFGLMWIAIIIQKLYVCATHACVLNRGVATSQLVTDVISDVLLLALPLCYLKGVKIESSQRILLVSSFSSSICITIVSITHTIYLILPHSAVTPVLAYVKMALALIICNLLVIVTFAYRVCRRNDLDVTEMPTKSGDVQLSSVIQNDI